MITSHDVLEPLKQALLSGKKKEPKPKLFGPDIFRWGGGLPRKGVGGQEVRHVPQSQGNQTLWRDIPGFCWDIPAVPEKFEKKCLHSILVPYSGVT